MKNTAKKILAIALPSAVVVSQAVAYSVGTTTTRAAGEFDTFLAEVLSWMNGPLGTLLAIVALGVGLTMGIMQQSLIAGIVGIFFAALVNYGPSILQGVSGSAEAAL